MIVVIADDLTGAAEIGGIGLRYGLKVLLSSEVIPVDKIDLLVIYTNARSLPAHEAATIMAELTKKVAAIKPSLFYKKTDSVLRGHVLVEMQAHMEALSVNKALLVPVNPLLGRIIKNENYYVNGRPVHEAGFANDPEFPIRDSRVATMLGADNGVQVLSATTALPEGISVGQASSMKEVRDWAQINESNVLYAGAASFFAALLHQRFVPKKVPAIFNLSLPLLLVSGTAYRQQIKKIATYEGQVNFMPATLFASDSLNETEVKSWAEDIVRLLEARLRCIIAIGRQESANADPEVLRKLMSAAVKNVLQKTKIEELLIEGGATAYAVIQELGFTILEPTEELQQGIVRMAVAGVDNLHLTIKPGSYEWPEEWNNAFE